MKKNFLLPVFSLLALGLPAQSICLHPDNPHYFLFRGKPVVIISSAEHYGAVINPAVSILNFHYAYPEVVNYNYGHNRMIGFDESGFSGCEDITYRKQAWRFILSGGGLFNNLDYSFYAGREDGTGTNKAPGGGSILLRQQLRILSEFIHSFDFLKMKPDYEFVKLAPGSFVRVLSEPGKQYALYLGGKEKAELKVLLPRGRFRMDWINTLDGKILKSEIIRHKSGSITFSSPDFRNDIALKIVRL